MLIVEKNNVIEIIQNKFILLKSKPNNKNMNKPKFIYLIMFFFLFQIARAQEIKKSNFYIDFKTGYSFPVANGSIGSPIEDIGQFIVNIRGNQSGDIISKSVKNPYNSRGAGFTLAGSLGYEISENFGVEVELSFVRSNNIVNASQDIDTSGLIFNANHTSHTIMFRAAPMLVVSGNKDLKFRPYAKFGLLIPFVGQINSDIQISDETGTLSRNLLPSLNPELAASIAENNVFAGAAIPTETNIKAVSNGAFSIGFASRVGVAYKVSDKISIIAELEMNMLTIKSKKTEVKNFNTRVTSEELVNFALENDNLVNFQSVYNLNDIPDIIRFTSYVDEITEMSNGTYSDVNATGYDRNKPREQLNFRDSFNSFGILLGLRYSF